MNEAVVAALYVSGGAAFLAAFLLSVKNYWRTRGITNYWLFVSIAAFFGTGWVGSFILTDVAGVTLPFIRQSQVTLAVTSLLGYVMSLSKAAATDVATKVI